MHCGRLLAGRRDNAIWPCEDHNRAISLCDSPAELPELHDQRRRTLTQMREYQAALRDAQLCVRLRPDDLYSGFELFVALALAGDYPGARDQHTQLAGHPRYRDPEFRIWIFRSAFRLLVSGHSLDFPADIIREEPFSMMRKAIDQYRVCQSFGTCLIPSAFGVPAWSPDGKELTYGRIDRYGMSRRYSTSGAPLVYESGGLEALNLESGRIRIIAPSGKGSAWAPNGKEILAGGVHEAELGLWSFDIEQGKAWQLFPSPAVLGSVSPDNSKIAIEIRDWFGGIWLAELDPADSIHDGVRCALTENEYLRRSCRDFAEAIRRGTYQADAYAHLSSFIARVGALADTYYRKGQYDDATTTAETTTTPCAIMRRPCSSMREMYGRDVISPGCRSLAPSPGFATRIRPSPTPRGRVS